MKSLNYEKNSFIIVGIIFFCMFLLMICFYTAFKRINNYQVLSGRIRKKNIVEVMIDTKHINILYQNNSVYINDKKTKFSIVEVSRDILKQSNTKYSLVLIEVKVDGIENDFVTLTFLDKKINLWKIFNVIWKGEE